MTERFLLRVAPKSRGDRAEEAHVALFPADPAGVIHMRGQGPLRRSLPAPSVARNDVSKIVPLKCYVRNFPKLPLDLQAHFVLAKRSGRLISQRLDDGEHFFFAHLFA